jgi:hypothetical protein
MCSIRYQTTKTTIPKSKAKEEEKAEKETGVRGQSSTANPPLRSSSTTLRIYVYI